MKETPVKHCKQCGQQLVQRKNESMPRFLNKRYCSSRCSRLWLKAHKQAYWQYKGGGYAIDKDEIEGRRKYKELRGNI